MRYTYISRYVAIEAGEYEITIAKGFRDTFLDDEAPELLRHWLSLLPSDDLLILPTSRPFACSYGSQGERWMVCEQQDEALPDGARCTQDSASFRG